MESETKQQHIPDNWWELLKAPLNQDVPYSHVMQGDTPYLIPIIDTEPDPIKLLFGKDSREDAPNRFMVAEQVVRSGALQVCIDQIRSMFAWQDSADYMRVEPAEEEKPAVYFGWNDPTYHHEHGGYFFQINGKTFILPTIS